MKKKLVLDFDELNSENFILGIVSSTPHLEFVHTLNKSGLVNFSRNEDLELSLHGNTEYFICFHWEDPDSGSMFYLVKNKGSAGIVGKEFKSMDYILIIRSEDRESFETITKFLSEHKLVQATINIPVSLLSERSKKVLPL